MQEHITKLSTSLERDAVYMKTVSCPLHFLCCHKTFFFKLQSKISRLPAYLTIQFVRFYYKEKESINAKILKDVKFPIDFDAFELCSPELQEKLTPMRTKFKVNKFYLILCLRQEKLPNFLLQELEDAQIELAAQATEKSKNKGDGKAKPKGNVAQYWFDTGKI